MGMPAGRSRCKSSCLPRGMGDGRAGGERGEGEEAAVSAVAKQDGHLAANS